MRFFRIFCRSIIDALKSVGRNFSLSLASISCTAITLIIVAIALIASSNVQNFNKILKSDITINIFLDETIDENQILVIEQKLKNLENIDKVTFKSKETIKEYMMTLDETYEIIMKEWNTEENPLQDAFAVQVKDIEKIEETANIIKKYENVKNVYYGEGLVEQLVSVFKSVEKGTYIAVGALIIVTIFLIINTIKLTIFSRKREISIMRLVGASNLTIKTPFVIEGLFLGIIGSIVPIIITIYGYFAFYNHFGGQLYSAVIKLIEPEPFVYKTSLIILVIGMLVGMLGSSRAVRKYLKV